jgi:hypothetical protein
MDGQPFCRGLQTAGGTPTTVNTGPNFFDLAGIAHHGGGSMQASLSFDNGTTFKVRRMHGYASASRLLTCRTQVLKSYIGGFPLPNEPPRAYAFDIPGDIRRGPAIFSWSWNNKLGNREFYQDCGPIVISSGDGSNMLEGNHAMFVANRNLGNPQSCRVTEEIPVDYPNPGPQIERGPDASKPPSGNC